MGQTSNKSQHTKLIQQKKLLLPLLPGLKLATFQSRTWCSTNKLSWLPVPREYLIIKHWCSVVHTHGQDFILFVFCLVFLERKKGVSGYNFLSYLSKLSCIWLSSSTLCTFLFYLLFTFYNCIVPVGFFPWEIRVAFPTESQLWQSRATQPTVHAGCFSVSIIHQTPTWTTGSLTCAQMLMHAIAHGVCGRT